MGIIHKDRTSRKKDMNFFVLLLVCWTPSLTTAAEVYKLAAGVGECTESDGSMITSEAECKKACNSLEGINRYVVGSWPESPGCFYFTVNKNCHWNKNKAVKWTAKAHRAVCKQSVDYKLAAGVGKCTESDGSMITSEAECKKACNSLKGINRYVVGNWPESPGCFYFTVNKNCHWNKNKEVKWTAKAHRAVCKQKEEIVE